MCNAYRKDIFDSGDPEQPDVIEWCEALASADRLLTMRKCSLSLFVWYQVHRSYCESLFGDRPISVDEVCWHLDMLPKLRNVKLQMIHAQAWQINAAKYRPVDYEYIPF